MPLSSTMKASAPFPRCAHYDPQIYAADDPDTSYPPKGISTDKAISRIANNASRAAVSDYYSEPVSSSPSDSPRAFSSPRTLLDPDTFTQDSEPVPFSSTPDLGSRTSSSSPNTEYDSQVALTPPEEKFVRTLDRKLEALVNTKNHQGISLRPRWLHHSLDQSEEEKYQSPESLAAADAYDTTSPSTHSVNSQHFLKRKRPEPRTREVLVDVETSADEDSDIEYEDKSTLPDVPVWKKLKETSFNYVATETASSRRAHSLSACSPHDSLVPTECASPSRPTTPVYKAPAVPIIAPPAFDAIPRPPLSPDDIAEARLKVLLRKERVQRRREGFEKGINDIFGSSVTKDQVDDLLGIDEDFRKDVIAWMLRITPSRKLGVGELRNQLHTCPETRFHAILLFTRYFMRVGDAMPIATERETPLMKLGRQRITWDVAMSCLAIAIKFNRDFLCPLSPVYAREFLVLAPHPMSHDDFEISQKDVLQALDYEIRDITPEPFMQEIWNSLSSLRKVLSFPDGWEATQVNTWHILNAAATASEMIEFPMSLLTAAALIEGTVAALADLYEQDVHESSVEETAREQAESVLADPVKDIRELMKISSVDMKRCRRWLQKNIRATY